MHTKTSIGDYENLCRLDVLAIRYLARDDSAMHENFKDQLRRNKVGCYETEMMWKGNSI